MTRPTLSVEAAFGTDPLTTPGSWTDITPYVREVSIRRGRVHELEVTQAGECVVRLANTDRRFDPTHASGPYYGNLRPMTRIRVRATHASTTYDLFTGYVEDWAQSWLGRPINGVGDAEAVVRLVDALKVLGRYQRAAYSSEVLADAPIGYWRLRESSGTTATNEGSVSGSNGTLTGGLTLGAAGPLIGGSTCASLDGTDDYVSIGTGANFDLAGRNATYEAWIYPTAAQAGGVLFCGIAAGLRGQIGLNASRYYTSDFQTEDDNFRSFTSILQAPLNTWTHVVVRVKAHVVELFLDGELAETLGELRNDMDHTGGTATIGRAAMTADFFAGRIAQVAVYDKALSRDRIGAHHTAAHDTFVAAGTGTQIGWLLDILGWPAGERSLDVGSSTAKSHTPDGNLLEKAQWLADSELGLLDVRGDGAIRFRRREAFEKLVTSASTWGDGPGELAYADLQVRYDDADLHTAVTVTTEGGSRGSAEDTSATAAYGPRILERTQIALSGEDEAQGQAEWLLSRYKAPALRVERLDIHGAADDSRLAQLLARDLGDRITVKRRPPGGGSPIVQESVIEQVNLSVKGTGWRGSWSLVPWEPTYWNLEDATYGLLNQTTRLGY